MIRVVALDGPAASGKSSTGAAVANQLGFLHVDSGSLYRGMTRVALDLSGFPTVEQILAEADRRGLGFHLVDGRVRLYLEGAPASGIRDEAVTAEVSAVSAMPEVREWVYHHLRGLQDTGRGLVMDGRDIGTNVFPDAPVKVYLDADPAVRAHRRLLQRNEVEPGRAEIAEEAERLRARDLADSTRMVAPLRPAEDAIRLDTSSLTFEEQVTRIVELVRRSPLHGDTPAG